MGLGLDSDRDPKSFSLFELCVSYVSEINGKGEHRDETYKSEKG